MSDIIDKILFGVMIALIVTCGALLVMNANLRAKLAVAQGDAINLLQANTSFKSVVDRQNAEVESLHRAELDRAAKLQAALQKAGQVKMRLATRSAALNNLKLPKDSCVAAQVIWREFVKSEARD